jgi:hypothetical protein
VDAADVRSLNQTPSPAPMSVTEILRQLLKGTPFRNTLFDRSFLVRH